MPTPIPAFLINLDRSTARLAHMMSAFDRLGIAYERVPAVDGQGLAPAELAAAGPLMTAGEVGCYLSHRSAWGRIAASGASFGAVFEDDIHVAASLATFLAAPDWIPDDAEIVKIDTMLNTVYMDRNGAQAPAGYRLARLRSTHSGGAGYILASVVAARLVDAAATPDRPVDAVLFEDGTGTPAAHRIYQLDPALCIQNDQVAGAGHDPALASDIHASRKAHRRRRKTPLTRLRDEGRHVAERIARTAHGWRSGYTARRIPFAGTHQ